MISALLAILSSTGIGSILGLLGGFANRWLDQRSKQADQEFELKKMDKEREYIKEEYAARISVATVEAEGLVESSAYNALKESYNFAGTSSKDGWVDKVSKGVRPFLTMAFFFLTVYIFYQVSSLVAELKLQPSTAEVWELYKYIISWIFFQAGTAIGWWFAMRPGRMPVFGSGSK